MFWIGNILFVSCYWWCNLILVMVSSSFLGIDTVLNWLHLVGSSFDVFDELPSPTHLLAHIGHFMWSENAFYLFSSYFLGLSSFFNSRIEGCVRLRNSDRSVVFMDFVCAIYLWSMSNETYQEFFGLTCYPIYFCGQKMSSGNILK